MILPYNGANFIVSKDYHIGDLVVIFPPDGQLSHEFCHYNNLYRDATKNADTTVTGFFEDTRRVRVQPFRGVKSEGFAVKISAFEWTGSTKELVQGLTFNELNGNPICTKYVTEATRKAQSRSDKPVKVRDHYMLNKHYDTEQIRYYMDTIPPGSFFIITEKLHGTSGRTGFVKAQHERFGMIASLVNRVLKREVIAPVVTEKYEYVTGTRNTICNNREDITGLGREHYRWQIHKSMIGRLRKGETIYYEIVGFDTFGSPIMNSQSIDKIKDKDLQKEIRDKFVKFPFDVIGSRPMVYSYGCNTVNDNGGMNPAFDFYVYRITVQNEDGIETELSWLQTMKRCSELFLKHVPVLRMIYIHVNEEQSYVSSVLNVILEKFLDNRCSTLDKRHLMEGVVIRVENTSGIRAYKAKNYAFQVLEGIVKEDPNAVDVEEAS